MTDPDPTSELDWLYELPVAADLTGLTLAELRERIARGDLPAAEGADGVLRVRLAPRQRQPGGVA